MPTSEKKLLLTQRESENIKALMERSYEDGVSDIEEDYLEMR